MHILVLFKVLYQLGFLQRRQKQLTTSFGAKVETLITLISLLLV